MFELTIKGDIASAHFIEGYKGPCQHLHGHTYNIEITIKSEQLNKIGMIADFSQLKSSFKEFLNHMDHACLNDLDFFKENSPTAEMIAKYVYSEFSAILDNFKDEQTGEAKSLRLDRVRVFESDLTSATYYES